MRPVVIFGTGELGQLAHYYFSNDSGRPVAGFSVDARYLSSPQTFMSLPVVAFEEIGAIFPPAEFDLFVAIGYSQLNAARAEKCAAARSLGYRLASYVSSRASVWPDLKLGDNCMVMEGNVIQPFVSIGDAAILFCGSIISHDVVIGDNCFIASGATVCGGVAIGYSQLNAARAEKCAAARSLGYRLPSYVSSRASVWSDLKLGDNCMVMEANVIQPCVSIGDAAILTCGSIISHDVVIGDNCFIASGATVCGGVAIASNCFIGANSTIREHLGIGEGCIVGAGALILRDMPAGTGYVESGTRDSGISSRRLRLFL